LKSLLLFTVYYFFCCLVVNNISDTICTFKCFSNKMIMMIGCEMTNLDLIGLDLSPSVEMQYCAIFINATLGSCLIDKKFSYLDLLAEF